MTPESEEWRAVVGYEGRYEASSLGRVRRISTGRLLSASPGGRYRRVVLQRLDGSWHTMHLHSVVVSAFFGPRPDGLVTRHLDGDPNNNTIANLRYGTSTENAADTTRHGRHFQGSKTHCKRGHPFDAENTYRQPSGRGCRACKRAAQTNPGGSI